MSPSNRLGGAVDPSAEIPAPAAVDESSADDAPSAQRGSAAPTDVDGNGRTGGSRSRRRRTTANPAATPPPARGSASQRGTSSSVVPRTLTEDDAPSPLGPSSSAGGASAASERPTAGAADPSASAAPTPAPAPPASAAPLAAPASVELPTARVADRDRERETLPVPAAPTTVLPSGEPRPPTLDERFVGPQIPSDAPPVTATVTTHDIAPVPRVAGRRPRVRKVTRVVRHVDPWSVFKIAAVANAVLYGIVLTSGVLLWNVAHATGTVDNMERFFESFGWDQFEFKGGEIFHAAWVAGLFGIVGLTGAAVLAATLFNLITDLVGGVRMTVLEEEVVERTTAPMRRFVVRRPTVDDSSPRPTPSSSPSPSGGTPAAGVIRPRRLGPRTEF